MKKTTNSKIGQNIMSFRGLQLVQDRRRPFITLSSIRNLSEMGGDIVKEAMKLAGIRPHRVFISWGMREFHTTCIRLQDLPTLNEKLNGTLPSELVTEITEDYRNLV